MTKAEIKDGKNSTVYVFYTDDNKAKIIPKEGSKFILFSLSNFGGLSPMFAASSDDLTADEVKDVGQMFKRVFGGALSGLQSMDGGVPLYTEHLNLRLTTDEATDLDELVDIEGMSKSQLIRSWIREKYSEFEEDEGEANDDE